MLRLACSWTTEKGIKVCAPVHDALLIESDEENIEDTVKMTQYIMGAASQKVLGGFKIRTDATIVRYPNRYMDKRSLEMWGLISRFIGAAEDRGYQN